MDYMFLTENQETLTVAVVVDKASGSIGATAVNHKGPEKSGVDYIATWLETFGYRQFEVHTDGEASSIACMRAAVSKYAATFPEDEKDKIVVKRRESPTDSHARSLAHVASRPRGDPGQEVEAIIGIVELASSVHGVVLQQVPADTRRSTNPV
jgi:hypothetical protein